MISFTSELQWPSGRVQPAHLALRLQASPLAMPGHLAGKRHTRAVARRFYVTSRRAGMEPKPPLETDSPSSSVMDTKPGSDEARSEGAARRSAAGVVSTHSQEQGGQGGLEQTQEIAAREQRRRLFDEHSSEPLRRNGWAEAPDVALMLLHSALEKT